MTRYVDSIGRYRTESLFFETKRASVQENFPPVYSLKTYPNNDLPSAYQIYMNSDSEYAAAIKLVGEMRHWRKLCNLKWFMDGIEEKSFDGLNSWREDKRLKDETEAIKLLKEQAENGNVTAQKTLYDVARGKGSTGAGRPKKLADTTERDENAAKIIALHKEINQRKG